MLNMRFKNAFEVLNSRINSRINSRMNFNTRIKNKL